MQPGDVQPGDVQDQLAKIGLMMAKFDHNEPRLATAIAALKGLDVSDLLLVVADDRSVLIAHLWAVLKVIKQMIFDIELDKLDGSKVQSPLYTPGVNLRNALQRLICDLKSQAPR